jgi:hypothetical protein
MPVHPGAPKIIGYRAPRSDSTKHRRLPGRGGPPQFPTLLSIRSAPLTPGSSSRLRFQALHRFHGLHPEVGGSALPVPHPHGGRRHNDAAGFADMLRTVSLLPLMGFRQLGFDPARFQTKPPVCYRASWQLPGPDFHRQATTSSRTARSAAHITASPLCPTGRTTELPKSVNEDNDQIQHSPRQDSAQHPRGAMRPMTTPRTLPLAGRSSWLHDRTEARQRRTDAAQTTGIWTEITVSESGIGLPHAGRAFGQRELHRESVEPNAGSGQRLRGHGSVPARGRAWARPE